MGVGSGGGGGYSWGGEICASPPRLPGIASVACVQHKEVQGREKKSRKSPWVCPKKGINRKRATWNMYEAPFETSGLSSSPNSFALKRTAFRSSFPTPTPHRPFCSMAGWERESGDLGEHEDASQFYGSSTTHPAAVSEHGMDSWRADCPPVPVPCGILHSMLTDTPPILQRRAASSTTTEQGTSYVGRGGFGVLGGGGLSPRK